MDKKALLQAHNKDIKPFLKENAIPPSDSMDKDMPNKNISFKDNTLSETIRNMNSRLEKIANPFDSIIKKHKKIEQILKSNNNTWATDSMWSTNNSLKEHISMPYTELIEQTYLKKQFPTMLNPFYECIRNIELNKNIINKSLNFSDVAKLNPIVNDIKSYATSINFYNLSEEDKNIINETTTAIETELSSTKHNPMSFGDYISLASLLLSLLIFIIGQLPDKQKQEIIEAINMNTESLNMNHEHSSTQMDELIDMHIQEFEKLSMLITKGCDY